MDENASQESLALVTVSGPSHVRLDLDPPGPYQIGRRPGHDLSLVGDDRVSRDHARITMRPGENGEQFWFVTDTGSKHGTRLHNVRLAPNRPTPMRAGDVLEIRPWTFAVVDRAAPDTGRTHIATRDDSTTAMASISAVRAEDVSGLARQRLDLLLDCASVISGATDEQSLANAVLDAAVSGARYSNAAFLKPGDERQKFELIAARGDIGASIDEPRLSRSLLRKASEGAPVRLSSGQGAGTINTAMSIAQFNIEEAMCVPIAVGGAVVAFLYLDNRRGSDRGAPSSEEARAFATGLGRLAAMALTKLSQVELEQRYARVEAELAAGAEAQRWIFPRGQGEFGALSYRGESRPGRFVGGDFFDVIEIDEHRLAVALGDVSGKGIPASVLMTASAGYLHGALQRHIDPGAAVTALNRFVAPRKPPSKFLTLWVGVFDLSERTLRYVDAGHGYAVAIAPDGSIVPLKSNRGGGLVGIETEWEYVSTTVDFEPGGRLLVLSDGFVEQPGMDADERVANRFGMEGVLDRIQSITSSDSPVEALFRLVEEHAGGPDLADDATALLVTHRL